MSTTVQQVHDIVAHVLLEPNGLISGTYTEAQFLTAFSTVILDFCQRTGLVKKIFTEMINAGVAEYQVPEDIMEVHLCFIGGRLIEKTSRADLDSIHFEWKKQWAIPRLWHEDNLEVKWLELFPKPNYNGTNIPGDVPPRGKYGDFYPTERNLTMVGTAAPDRTTWALGTTIQIVPDSFVHYLAYGILAEIFSQDGETRDPQRAAYCTTRYNEGVQLAELLLGEEREDA